MFAQVRYFVIASHARTVKCILRQNSSHHLLPRRWGRGMLSKCGPLAVYVSCWSFHYNNRGKVQIIEVMLTYLCDGQCSLTINWYSSEKCPSYIFHFGKLTYHDEHDRTDQVRTIWATTSVSHLSFALVTLALANSCNKNGLPSAAVDTQSFHRRSPWGLLCD